MDIDSWERYSQFWELDDDIRVDIFEKVKPQDKEFITSVYMDDPNPEIHNKAMTLLNQLDFGTIISIISNSLSVHSSDKYGEVHRLFVTIGSDNWLFLVKTEYIEEALKSINPEENYDILQKFFNTKRYKNLVQSIVPSNSGFYLDALKLKLVTQNPSSWDYDDAPLVSRTPHSYEDLLSKIVPIMGETPIVDLIRNNSRSIDDNEDRSLIKPINVNFLIRHLKQNESFTNLFQFYQQCRSLGEKKLFKKISEFLQKRPENDNIILSFLESQNEKFKIIRHDWNDAIRTDLLAKISKDDTIEKIVFNSNFDVSFQIQAAAHFQDQTLIKKYITDFFDYNTDPTQLKVLFKLFTDEEILKYFVLTTSPDDLNSSGKQSDVKIIGDLAIFQIRDLVIRDVNLKNLVIELFFSLANSVNEEFTYEISKHRIGLLLSKVDLLPGSYKVQQKFHQIALKSFEPEIVGKKSIGSDLKQTAITYIYDQNLLTDIVLKSQYSRIRNAAFHKIRDQPQLERIALESTDLNNKQIAIESLRKEGILPDNSKIIKQATIKLNQERERERHNQSVIDEEKRRRQSSIKILKTLQNVSENVPLIIPRLAEIAQTNLDETILILKNILLDDPSLGDYLELEQVFIKHRNTDPYKIDMMEKSIKVDALQTCPNCNDLQSVLIRTCTSCNNPLINCNICKRGFSNNEPKLNCPDCSNQFHKNHLLGYIQSIGKCPICRVSLTMAQFE